MFMCHETLNSFRTIQTFHRRKETKFHLKMKKTISEVDEDGVANSRDFKTVLIFDREHAMELRSPRSRLL